MSDEPSLDGSPADVLTDVEAGDELELFFDRYNQGYEVTPQSPVQSTVLEVTEKELTAEEDLLPGTLRSVELAVAEDDDTADRYWIEHRTEFDEDGEHQSASSLLYEYEMVPGMETSGTVGHIDRITVFRDEE